MNCSVSLADRWLGVGLSLEGEIICAILYEIVVIKQRDLDDLEQWIRAMGCDF